MRIGALKGAVGGIIFYALLRKTWANQFILGSDLGRQGVWQPMTKIHEISSGRSGRQDNPAANSGAAALIQNAGESGMCDVS